MYHRKKNIACTIFALCASVALIAQTVNNSQFDFTTSTTLDLQNIEKFKKEDLDYNQIKGDPFLYPEYVYGKLALTTGEILDSVLLKYDRYTQNFIAKKSKSEEIFVDTRLCKEIVMDVEGDQILFKRANPKTPHTFFEILLDKDDMMIFKEVKVGINEGKDNGIVKTEDRFYDKEQYYIREGRAVKKIKRKKKHIWKLFDADEISLMEDFMKANNIKLKSDKDYRKVFSTLTTE